MMNKGQLAGLMKQAQQMQENMRKMQEQVGLMEVEGQSGAGLVKAVMTGKHESLRGLARGPSRARVARHIGRQQKLFIEQWRLSRLLLTG